MTPTPQPTPLVLYDYIPDDWWPTLYVIVHIVLILIWIGFIAVFIHALLQRRKHKGTTTPEGEITIDS